MTTLHNVGMCVLRLLQLKPGPRSHSSKKAKDDKKTSKNVTEENEESDKKVDDDNSKGAEIRGAGSGENAEVMQTILEESVSKDFTNSKQVGLILRTLK